MSEESNINPPTESPAPVDIPPPAPVAPTEAPPTETSPVVVPDPVTPPAVPVVTPAPAVQPPPNPLLGTGGGTDVRSLLAKAMAKIQFRKQAKLEKIMVLARKQGQVTNDQAQTRRFSGRAILSMPATSQSPSWWLNQCLGEPPLWLNSTI